MVFSGQLIHHPHFGTHSINEGEQFVGCARLAVDQERTPRRLVAVELANLQRPIAWLDHAPLTTRRAYVDFEKAVYFEGCLPVEAMAERGIAKGFVKQWLLDKSLYERYGGRVIFQQMNSGMSIIGIGTMRPSSTT